MWRDVGQQEKEFATVLSAPSTAKGSFKTSPSFCDNGLLRVVKKCFWKLRSFVFCLFSVDWSYKMALDWVIKNMSLYTNPHVVANLHEFHYSVENKRRNSKDCAGSFNYNESFTEKIPIKRKIYSKFSVNNNLNFSLFLTQCYYITSEDLQYSVHGV